MTGIEFKLKDFRPTYVTMSVERDPNLLPDISTMLGHSDIETTQRYYAQISSDSAGRRIEEDWERKLAQSGQQKPKNNLIESKKWNSGYIW